MDVDRTPFIERAKQINQKWQQEGFWRPGLLDEIEAVRKK